MESGSLARGCHEVLDGRTKLDALTVESGRNDVALNDFVKSNIR